MGGRSGMGHLCSLFPQLKPQTVDQNHLIHGHGTEAQNVASGQIKKAHVSLGFLGVAATINPLGGGNGGGGVNQGPATGLWPTRVATTRAANLVADHPQ